uniref:Uncharacterized protein n=1 Tax=Picea sitchensis TaxID=3332 RepID=A9NQX9_PICSI|nr:unknown [Picea sitchensis]
MCIKFKGQLARKGKEEEEQKEMALREETMHIYSWFSSCYLRIHSTTQRLIMVMQKIP